MTEYGSFSVVSLPGRSLVEEKFSVFNSGVNPGTQLKRRLTDFSGLSLLALECVETPSNPQKSERPILPLRIS